METSIKTKFNNWILKTIFAFLENDLFQPVGLELSCVEIVLETAEDYKFKKIKESEFSEKDYPLAYYNPWTDSIHIFIEHYSFKIRESDFEKMSFLMFILFHEANHRLLMHTKRWKEKDKDLFNIASDMEIHNMFYVYDNLMKLDQRYEKSIIKKMTEEYVEDFLFVKKNKEKNEGLFEKEFLQYTAEEIYTILENSKEENTQTFSLSMGNGNGDEQDNGQSTVTVKNITYKMPSGKDISTTIIDFPENIKNSGNSQQEQGEDEGAFTRKTLMENNLQKKIEELGKTDAINRGLFPNECRTFLKKLFHVKIDWKKILRNSLQTVLEKSECFSWAQPRTSLFGLSDSIYLPGQIEDDTKFGTVIIARDESGSMSDKECAIAAGIIADAKDYYEKIVILKHDVKITSVNIIDDAIDKDIEKMLLTRNSNGGTSHKEVFEFIKDYEKKNDEKISCCIFITDMWSDIPENQDLIPNKVPLIWLTIPDSAMKFKDKVRGKIIPIEI